MGLGYRTYIVEDDGSLTKIAKRVYEGLVDQTDSLPEYAGKRIQLLYVVIENENGKPVRITRTDGSFLKLDDSGFTESPLG